MEHDIIIETRAVLAVCSLGDELKKIPLTEDEVEEVEAFFLKITDEVNWFKDSMKQRHSGEGNQPTEE